MSLWTRIRDVFARRTTLAGPIPPRDPALVDLWRVWQPADSGVLVSENTAVSWTAVASGIRLCAETVASLPIDIGERLEPRGRKPRPDHPLAQVLSYPNEEMSPFEFIELMQAHQELWGNCYAQIVFDNAQRPKELWPLNPDRVTMERNSAGEVQYRILLPDEAYGYASKATVLPADEVLHIRGWSRCGLLGERMAVVFRQAIGLGIATEAYGARFFGQGAHAGGILQHPGRLSKEAGDRLTKRWDNQVSGIDRAHRTALLEEGMTWQQTTVDPEKAQFLATRKFQVDEVARILRIPPHMIYDLERATFTNIEQQGIEFVTYSVLPRVNRWEDRLAMQLLGQKDRYKIQIKFNVAALLRGDTQAQTAAFTAGRQGGWLSANDVRELMDLNPIRGGDVYAPLPAGVPGPAPAGGKSNGGEDQGR